MRQILFYFFALLLVVVAFFAVGYFTKYETVTKDITIGASPQICWDVYNDTEKMDKWVDNFKALRRTGGEQNEVGSTYDLILHAPEEEGENIMHEEFSRVEPYEVHELKYYNDYLSGTITTTFKEKGDSTIVTTKNKYTGKSVFLRSVFHFMKGNVQKITDTQYDKLKAYIEKNNPIETEIVQDSLGNSSVQDPDVTQKIRQ